ncbi:MAG TPA: hypothetical protein VLT58_00005, partial [Polyangia bacterium]|nr:hypothetical protein [Polyangia bacterium]
MRLDNLLPGAAGALIVAAGGRTFFERFSRAPERGDGAPDPLDRYTARTAAAAVSAALIGSGA